MSGRCTVGEHWGDRGNGTLAVYLTAITSDEWMGALLDGQVVEYEGAKYLVAGATPVVRFDLIPVVNREDHNA